MSLPRRVLVLIGGPQVVDAHFLVENLGCGPRYGRHNPHPISRAPATKSLLVLVMFHEGLRCRVVVNYCYVMELWKLSKGQWLSNYLDVTSNICMVDNERFRVEISGFIKRCIIWNIVVKYCQINIFKINIRFPISISWRQVKPTKTHK